MATITAEKPGFNPWFIRVPLLILLGTTLTGLALFILLFLYQIGIAGRIVPGVWANGVSIGGYTPTDAAAMLNEQFTYPKDAVFTFRYEESFWQVPAGDLGVALDAEKTVEAAFAIGHTGPPAQRLAEQVNAWTQGRSVAPVVTYNEGLALAEVVAIAAEIDRPAQDAALLLDGTTVETTVAQTGRIVDVQAAMNLLETHIRNLDTGAEIPLVVIDSEPAHTEVEATAAYIRTALSGPIMLTASGPDGTPLGPWTIRAEQIAPLLTVEQAGTDYLVSVDMSHFAGLLEELAPGLIAPARNGRFHFNDGTGELEVIEPAQNGRTINVEETIARMEEAVFQVEGRNVEIAYDETLPRYHNDITAADLGITERVSESTTLYTGSTAARRQNIQVGAARYDGIIIGPGETFSFNDILGDISEEAGFTEGAIIFGGRTVQGIGGGICQVSTTAFRAAFSAGFPIVERYSHGYRVGYYELGGVGPGLDAAIYSPTADFKFTNDTDDHLLIETEFLPDRDAVQFRYYSTNPGREVRISEPVVRNVTSPPATIYEANQNLNVGQQLQVDWSKEGGDVIITRTIIDTQTDSVIERRDFPTFYQPWAAVVQVSPGDPRLSNS